MNGSTVSKTDIDCIETEQFLVHMIFTGIEKQLFMFWHGIHYIVSKTKKLKTYFPGSSNLQTSGANSSKLETETNVFTVQQHSTVKVFSNADLWNIQRRRKSISVRRSVF